MTHFQPSALTAMDIKFREVQRRKAELDAEQGQSRDHYDLAPAEQRAKMDAPFETRRVALALDAGSFQRARVAELERDYAANTPHLLQLKAALQDPSRFNAVAAMAARLPEPEQLKVARLLKRTGDGAGAAGLCAVASGEAVAIARTAGTDEARAHLVALLRGNDLLAKTVRLVDADPERVLEACAEASSVRLEDGTIKSFSDRELAELLGDEA